MQRQFQIRLNLENSFKRDLKSLFNTYKQALLKQIDQIKWNDLRDNPRFLSINDLMMNIKTESFKQYNKIIPKYKNILNFYQNEAYQQGLNNTDKMKQIRGGNNNLDNSSTKGLIGKLKTKVKYVVTKNKNQLKKKKQDINIKQTIQKNTMDQLKRTRNLINNKSNEHMSEVEDKYPHLNDIDSVKTKTRDIFSNISDMLINNSTTIAMTLTSSLVNIASYISSDYIQWCTMEDEHVRDSHAEQDLMIQEWGAYFPNGCQYPGDTNAEPSEFINCRCHGINYSIPDGFMPPEDSDTGFYEEDLVPVESDSVIG